ncbi:MAG TPA: hypothetical protein H9821_04770 [Candidatus Rothia avicola]|uniref:Uncharacterized protein n=1 Tax=Candidatus Rothia avicola TaxID=2840478 RepID=A0A9D1ZRS7_9MICC|nr:hypothetical protein [Candidatus Rothia avicola]
MTPDELTRLRQLHEQASPAPWHFNTFGYLADIVDDESEIVLELGPSALLDEGERQDATLMVEARNALSALLDTNEKLTQRAERAEALLARINRAHPEIYEQALAASTAAEAQAWEEGFTQGAAYYHESGKEPADFTETATTLNPYKEQA